MQTHQPVLGVVEGVWDGGENLEAQRLPEMHSRVVGLDYRVELDAPLAAGPGPIEDVSAQGPPYSLAVVIRVDHEAGGGHV